MTIKQHIKTIMIDYFNGDEMNYAMEQQLEYVASGMDIDPDVMLQLIENSISTE